MISNDLEIFQKIPRDSPSSYSMHVTNAQLASKEMKLHGLESFDKNINRLQITAKIMGRNELSLDNITNEVAAISMCLVRSWKTGLVAM